MAGLTGDTLALRVGQILAGNSELGLTPAGVAALLGNAGVESAGFSTGQQFGGGPGRGLFQWEGERRLGFEQFLKDNGFYTPSTGYDYTNPEANAGYLAAELLGSEGNRSTYEIPGVGTTTVLSALRNPKISHSELTDVVHQEFERPRDVLGGAPTLASQGERQKYADQYYNIYNQKGGWDTGTPDSPDFTQFSDINPTDPSIADGPRFGLPGGYQPSDGNGFTLTSPADPPSNPYNQDVGPYGFGNQTFAANPNYGGGAAAADFSTGILPSETAGDYVGRMGAMNVPAGQDGGNWGQQQFGDMGAMNVPAGQDGGNWGPQSFGDAQAIAPYGFSDANMGGGQLGSFGDYAPSPGMSAGDYISQYGFGGNVSGGVGAGSFGAGVDTSTPSFAGMTDADFGAQAVSPYGFGQQSFAANPNYSGGSADFGQGITPGGGYGGMTDADFGAQPIGAYDFGNSTQPASQNLGFGGMSAGQFAATHPGGMTDADFALPGLPQFAGGNTFSPGQPGPLAGYQTTDTGSAADNLGYTPLGGMTAGDFSARGMTDADFTGGGLSAFSGPSAPSFGGGLLGAPNMSGMRDSDFVSMPSFTMPPSNGGMVKTPWGMALPGSNLATRAQAGEFGGSTGGMGGGALMGGLPGGGPSGIGNFINPDGTASSSLLVGSLWGGSPSFGGFSGGGMGGGGAP